MKNTLADLNNHLFAQLERLGDEELTGEALAEEVERAKSINDVAGKIISNANLILDAEKFKFGGMAINGKMPAVLENKNHD